MLEYLPDIKFMMAYDNIIPGVRLPEKYHDRNGPQGGLPSTTTHRVKAEVESEAIREVVL